MFSSFFIDPFDIKSITEFSIDTILNLPDVTALFYINKEYLKSEEETRKFNDFTAL